MATAMRGVSDLVKGTNLPVQLTSFVGRAAEIEEVKGLLLEGRLVTLTGAGASARRDSPSKLPVGCWESTRTASGWRSSRA